MSSVLKILDVACIYDSAEVLGGITFSLDRGTFTGIVGPNGCGKTTLLKTISRSIEPVRGSVLLDEQDVRRFQVKKLARKMAVVPQETQVNFSIKVRDMVLMGRSPYLGLLQNEGQADYHIAEEAMKLTNTAHLADRSITGISGGERQRVVIARALAQDPEVMLLDEPTSHLDINNQVEILDLIADLAATRNLTVIAALHDLNLAARYCESIILIHRGRIFSMGRPEAVLTAENIKTVYGASVRVQKDRATGCTSFIPEKKKSISRAPLKGRVHVICGGGAGAPVMEDLVKSGFKVSAGVLNTGDVDLEAARELGAAVTEEAPFSPISDHCFRQNLERIMIADACILADIPFGKGNLKNLESAVLALKGGKPVIVLESGGIAERDYTGGRAQELYLALLKGGAVVAADNQALLAALESIKDA